MEDLDEEQLNSGENFEIDSLIIDDEYDRIGNEGEKVIEQMMEMDNIVKNCGWMNECIDGLPNVDTNAIQPDIIQGASKWDAAVQVKQQQYIEEKNSKYAKSPKIKADTGK